MGAHDQAAAPPAPASDPWARIEAFKQEMHAYVEGHLNGQQGPHDAKLKQILAHDEAELVRNAKALAAKELLTAANVDDMLRDKRRELESEVRAGVELVVGDGGWNNSMAYSTWELNQVPAEHLKGMGPIRSTSAKLPNGAGEVYHPDGSVDLSGPDASTARAAGYHVAAQHPDQLAHFRGAGSKIPPKMYFQPKNAGEHFAEMYRESVLDPEMVYSQYVSGPAEDERELGSSVDAYEQWLKQARSQGDKAGVAEYTRGLTKARAGLAQVREERRVFKEQHDVMRGEVFGLSDEMVKERVAQVTQAGLVDWVLGRFEQSAEVVMTPGQLDQLTQDFLAHGITQTHFDECVGLLRMLGKSEPMVQQFSEVARRSTWKKDELDKLTDAWGRNSMGKLGEPVIHPSVQAERALVGAQALGEPEALAAAESMVAEANRREKPTAP